MIHISELMFIEEEQKNRSWIRYIYPVKQIIDNLELCVVSNWYVLIGILFISSLIVMGVNVVLLSDR